MKLKSIKLQNIGLYKNEVIEFPYKSKSTIIIWGNNGAGKTTLINSVKVGLLGKNAVQMTYPEYCDFIKSKLISTRCNIKRENASIEIEIELNDNNKKDVYRVIRNWSEKNGVFVENDYIYQGDLELKVDDKDYIKNVINRTLPSSLLDVIVFDGENAINILNEGKMSKLIKEILYSVFGMDIYSALSKDLSVFLHSAKSNNNISTEEQLNFIKIETNYKAALKNFKKFEGLVKEQKKQKVDKLRELNFIINRFAEKTGIGVEDLELLNKNLANVESNKEKMNADLKFISEEILPLKLVHRRIKEIIHKIDDNQSYNALKSINSLKLYFENVDEARVPLKKLESLLPEEIPPFAYDYEDSEVTLIKKVNSILSTYTKESMMNLIDEKNDYLKDIKEKIEISKKVETNESKKLLMNLENLYKDIETIDISLSTLEEEKNNSEVYLNDIKKEYTEKKLDITKQKKESSSYIAALKYRESIDEFIKTNIITVCAKINNILFNYLSEMKFRNDSIGRVEISPKTFEINLFEKKGEVIPSYWFSAGEKQVLLGLIIKASLSLSNIDCFFLFDTPVGRLDKKNREIFTKEVIFSVSDQAFIFATDSDYSEDDYDKIKSNVSLEFKLKRNEIDEIIAVEGSAY